MTPTALPCTETAHLAGDRFRDLGAAGLDDSYGDAAVAADGRSSRSLGARSGGSTSAGRTREQRHKPAGVVAIAVARELAGFLWVAATLD